MFNLIQNVKPLALQSIFPIAGPLKFLFRKTVRQPLENVQSVTQPIQIFNYPLLFPFYLLLSTTTANLFHPSAAAISKIFYIIQTKDPSIHTCSFWKYTIIYVLTRKSPFFINSHESVHITQPRINPSNSEVIGHCGRDEKNHNLAEPKQSNAI